MMLIKVKRAHWARRRKEGVVTPSERLDGVDRIAAWRHDKQNLKIKILAMISLQTPPMTPPTMGII